VMARCRPNLSATSFPRMLAGIEMIAKLKLMTKGVNQDGAP
jgi:hypothetical protein